MEFRKTLAAAVGALAILVGVLPNEARAEETLKIGTLAPKQSIWGQVFSVWATAVDKKSDSKLKLDFFYNGQQGDEGAMVAKMKAGQLDGAAITAVGLSKIYKPILALQMPGALTSWDKLDKAQSSLQTEFEKGVSDAGFDLVGWGNVGQAHFFTKGSGEVRVPDDLKARKPYMWRDDMIQPVLYQVINATPVPLNVPEVLPNLKTSAIDALAGPALAVEQLQWGPELNTVNDDVNACAIGALVFSSSRLKALPSDLKKVLTDTGNIASKALGQKVKDEDSAAYGRLSSKMNVIKLSSDERSKWNSVFKETRKRLGQGTFDAALIKRIEDIAGI